VLAEGFPHADLAAAVVWINMLPTDAGLTAQFAARGMPDARLRFFHDPDKAVGRAVALGSHLEVAQSLGAPDQVAWDVYLFFDKGAEWREALPAPTRWAHQLGDPWADPARYFTGGELVQELARAMQEALHLARG
jgi:hypothetical protein